MTKVQKVCGANEQHSRQKWVLAVGALLITLALLFRAHFRLSIVAGNSMLPTLEPGDVLLVDTRAYRKAEPHRGDVVVARDATGFIVKRVVGLPGEEIEVKSGKLYINGTPSVESYPTVEGWLDVGEGKLLAGDFATLGDNRAVPATLAVHPVLSKPDILGKVVFHAHRLGHLL